MIPYLLTRKAEHALSHHPMSEDWVPSPWDCADPGPLTVTEATEVLADHEHCGPSCRISRTARKVRATWADAPTVRARAVRLIR